jgi:hypothetical protein
VVVKVRGGLSVSKEAAQKIDMERFYLRKINDVEVRVVKVHYQVKN